MTLLPPVDHLLPEGGTDPEPPRDSTRRTTRTTGVFTRETPGSRSLERGLALLRAFRPGTSSLGNAELAQRTGLPRPTVTRLTRSLVDSGFLDFDAELGAYRLGAPFLSLGHTVRQASVVLELALPLMRQIAEASNINVGLALADGDDMVYLDSVRRSRAGVFRRIVSGSRVPIELTALGRAWLAGVDAETRRRKLAAIAPRHGQRWPSLAADIEDGLARIAREGYCSAVWQAGLVSIAAPLCSPGVAVHSVNISFSVADGDLRTLETRYAPSLLRMVERFQEALAQRRMAAGAR